jgi:hypothetical protein
MRAILAVSIPAPALQRAPKSRPAAAKVDATASGEQASIRMSWRLRIILGIVNPLQRLVGA